MPTALGSLPSTDTLQAGAFVRPERGPGASLYYAGATSQLTPDVLANKFQALWEYCDNYRKKFVPEMLEAFNQYNGELDNQTKEPWQSNIHVPLPSQAIDVAAGRIVSAMFEQDDFFEVAPSRRADDLLTEFAKNSTLWQIQKSEGLPEVQTSIKDALICGFGPLKVHYQVSMEPYTDVELQNSKVISLFGETLPAVQEWNFVDAMRLLKRIRFEALIPTDVWKDPTGKNRFLIQRTTRYVSDLWDATKDLRDPDTNAVVRKAVYDPKQVARVKPGMHDTQRQIEAARIRRDLATPYGLIDQTVDVYELWGDFVDVSTGAILYRNQVSTFVDRRFTIRMPQRNPLRHAKPPFILISCKNLPHQVYGYGLLFQNRRIQDAVNRHANVILDKAMLQVPTLEYDASACKDPNAFGGDRPVFKPGKQWPRKPGPDKRIFYPVEGFQPVQPMDLAVLDRLTNWYQTGSMVSEFTTGQQLSNNRKTAREVQQREQSSQQNFNDAAVHIEQTAITPMLKMIYLTMVQYEDQYDDIELERMFGNDNQQALMFIDQLKDMTPAERWKTLYLDSEFKAVGITNELTRQKRLQEVTSFVQTINSDPLMSLFIDKREELGIFTELFRQPNRLILGQAGAMLQAAQAAQVSQMLGPMMGPQGPAGAPNGMQGGPGGQARRQLGPGGGQSKNPHNALAHVNAEAGRG